MDALLQTNLTQHVHVPTRRENVLDLVFTKDDTSAVDVRIETPLGKSDHDVVTFNLLCRAKQNREKTFAQPCFKKANFVGMKAWLADELSGLIWDGQSVSDIWDKIESVIKEGIAKFVPHRRRQRNLKPVWADAYAMRALRLQRNSHRAYQRKRSVQSYDRYLMARDIACASIRKSKELFERRLAENIKQDKKSFWRYLNGRRVAKPSAGPVIDPTLGAPTTNDQQCAEVFNEYFASIFTVEDTNVPFPPSRTDHILEDVVITADTVKKHLRDVKIDAAPGIDGISNRVLLECADVLAEPLAKLFRKSIRTGSLPVKWKTARVVPIHKNGDRTEAGNYRPVSLLPSAGKLLEKDVGDAITDHLESNRLLKCSQFGFRSHRSCESQLVEFLDFVTTCVNDGDVQWM